MWGKSFPFSKINVCCFFFIWYFSCQFFTNQAAVTYFSFKKKFDCTMCIRPGSGAIMLQQECINKKLERLIEKLFNKTVHYLFPFFLNEAWGGVLFQASETFGNFFVLFSPNIHTRCEKTYSL